MSTAQVAVEARGIVEMMSDDLAWRIMAAQANGTGQWVWDQEVAGVAGFQVRKSPDSQEWVTVVIAYLEDEDFECNDRWATTGEL